MTIFRFLWLLITVATWILALSLSLHTSEAPAVFHRYSPSYFGFLIVVFLATMGVSAANSAHILERIYARRWSIILCIGSTVFALGILEVFVRFADPLGVSYYQESARYHLDKIADPNLVFRHRSSWRTVYQGVDVRFNELGLRGEPIPPKQESEYRILVLGDSVTFGFGVAESDTFTSRLERALRTTRDRSVRVINSGVGGYNTVQEYAYLKHKGLSLSPDLVILVYVTNDIDVNEGPFDPWSQISLSGKSPPQISLSLLGKSWLYRLVAHAYRYGLFGTMISDRYESTYASKGWKDSMAALRGLTDTVVDRQIPLMVFFFRWEPNTFNTRLLEAVRSAVAPAPVEDMAPWFSGTDLRRYTNSQIDSHPNAEGHRIIAEHIANIVLARLGTSTAFARDTSIRDTLPVTGQ